MKINLWYCKDMTQWRWTVVDDRRPICKQESGQQKDMKSAMEDITSAVETLMKEN